MRQRTPCEGVNDPACVARFWAKVAAPNETGCRLWLEQIGTRRPRYRGGPFHNHRRQAVATYAFAWELAYGPVPAGLYLLHSCDTPRCCEASHVRPGTPAENSRDRHERHVNAAGGEGHGMAKLTHREAAAIVELYATGEWLQRDLALMYGVSGPSVSRILSGKQRRVSHA